MRILIIEDEKKIADVVESRLKKENYAVDVSYDGQEGLDNCLTNIYDLIVLDVMLPSVNGLDILKEIKKENISSKVIMLTAKSQIEDKLESFSNGADDYLTKPFHIEELVARVNLLMRKKDEHFKDYLETFDLKLYTNTSEIECVTTGEKIEVICKEFLLLEYFMQNPNVILEKEKIYEKVWGVFSEAESNNLEAYLSFVRKKLKAIGSNSTIKAVRGLGYRFEQKKD